MDDLKWPCKCGGEVGIRPAEMAISHTLPQCKEFEVIDLDSLIRIPGALAQTIIKMRKDVASA